MIYRQEDRNRVRFTVVRGVCSSLVAHLAANATTSGSIPGILPNIVNKVRNPERSTGIWAQKEYKKRFTDRNMRTK